MAPVTYKYPSVIAKLFKQFPVTLNQNPHDEAVRFLIKRVKKLNWRLFMRNENPMAVKFTINHLYKFNIGKPWTLSQNHPQYQFQLYVRTTLLEALSELSLNSHPAVVRYLLKHRHLINWFNFSQNTSPIAVGFLLKNRKNICWDEFSSNSNPAAVRLLLKHPENICWWQLAVNENILAVKKLLEHPELIDYSRLNTNSCQLAVDHLLSNQDKIEYFHFSLNINPAAVDHTINSKKIDILRSRFQLNTNPVATEYTLNHMVGNINNLGSNPSIFVLDYPAMSSIRTRQLDRELCAAVYVPKRMSLLLTHHLEHGDILDFCY